MIAEELAYRLRSSDPKNLTTVSRLERTLKRLLLETNSVLLLSKADSGLLNISTVPLAIEDLINECINNFAVVFESAHTDLILSIEPDLPKVYLDPAVFPSVITNLLDNALKYGIEKSPVKVRIQKSDTGVEILVSTLGPELSPSDTAELFKRFFRGENAVGKPGSGLGLYLCREILSLHMGQIGLHRIQDENVFKISVPLEMKSK